MHSSSLQAAYATTANLRSPFQILAMLFIQLVG